MVYLLTLNPDHYPPIKVVSGSLGAGALHYMFRREPIPTDLIPKSIVLDSQIKNVRFVSLAGALDHLRGSKRYINAKGP